MAGTTRRGRPAREPDIGSRLRVVGDGGPVPDGVLDALADVLIEVDAKAVAREVQQKADRKPGSTKGIMDQTG